MIHIYESIMDVTRLCNASLMKIITVRFFGNWCIKPHFIRKEQTVSYIWRQRFIVRIIKTASKYRLADFS